MYSVKLPRQIVNKILTLAQEKSDKEVCGLISLNSDDKMKLFSIANIATDDSHFFAMEPSETIQAMKSMRDDNAELFAIFHSHPSTPATPSKTDIAEVGYPDALYLIISLNTKGVLELKAYQIHDEKVINIDLAI